MANISIGKFSQKSKQRPCRRAAPSGLDLEPIARTILDEAASEEPVRSSRFPHDLIAVIEAGEEIEAQIRTHDRSQVPVEL